MDSRRTDVGPYVKKDGTVVSGHTKNVRIKPAERKDAASEAVREVIGEETLAGVADMGAEETTAAEVIFALDPETSPWVEAGFTYDSNWKHWAFAGVEPRDATPRENPLFFREVIFRAPIEISRFLAKPKYGLTVNDFPATITRSFRSLFAEIDNFNENIDNWDVSQVENMTSAFADQELFNQPLGSWDTGNVLSFDSMFKNAKSFNQDISGWDTSKAELMGGYVSGC